METRCANTSSLILSHSGGANCFIIAIMLSLFVIVPSKSQKIFNDVMLSPLLFPIVAKLFAILSIPQLFRLVFDERVLHLLPHGMLSLLQSLRLDDRELRL